MNEGQSARERLKISGRGPIEIRTAQDAIDVATWCYESEYLPKHIKSPKQAFTIMQRGAEMGLPMFSAWRYIYQTKGGKLAIESKGALAVVQSKATFGYYKERIEGEGDGRMAVATACRKGSEHPIIKEFTMEDAKLAGLLKRPKTREGREYDGPWQAYIKDMLLSKARSRALDIAFAAELGGIPIEGQAEEIDARETQRAPKVRNIQDRLPERPALPPGEPAQGLTDLIRGKDFVPVVVEPTQADGSGRLAESEALKREDPIEAHVAEQVEAQVEAPEEPPATTCQEKLSPTSLCSSQVVPGTDRCSKHHFPEAEGESEPDPPGTTELAGDLEQALGESPFAHAIRDRAAKKFDGDEPKEAPKDRGLFDTEEE
jgi:hypothetical protein